MWTLSTKMSARGQSSVRVAAGELGFSSTVHVVLEDGGLVDGGEIAARMVSLPAVGGGEAV